MMAFTISATSSYHSQGTYNMEANDVRNPTMIKLTDVDDPTYYYVLTKQAYPATQGMK